jgi:LPXTG-motif cell wall-anchored protein
VTVCGNAVGSADATCDTATGGTATGGTGGTPPGPPVTTGPNPPTNPNPGGSTAIVSGTAGVTAQNPGRFSGPVQSAPGTSGRLSANTGSLAQTGMPVATLLAAALAFLLVGLALAVGVRRQRR